MAIINQGLQNNSPQSLDRAYGKIGTGGRTIPYASVGEANSAVLSVYRHIGKTVLIDDGSGPVEYWWKDGISDVDLVAKVSLTSPFKVMLSSDGYYDIPVNLLVDKILVIPAGTITLKIGFSAGAEDLVPSLTMQPGQANIINVDVAAWGSTQRIYFSGITVLTELLIYRRTMIPSNP